MEPELLTALGAIITALGTGTALIIKQVNAGVKEVDKKVSTSNGTSAGELVELIHTAVKSNGALLTQHVGDQEVHCQEVHEHVRSIDGIDSTGPAGSGT
jgi:hypothetical protein